MSRRAGVGDEQWAMEPDCAAEIVWLLQHPEGDDWTPGWGLEEMAGLFAAGQRGFRILEVGPELTSDVFNVRYPITGRSAGSRSLADGDPLTSVRR